MNNWANGFLLETGSTAEASNLPTFQPSNPGTYIIIFWPQYLQYAGFLILVLTFAVLFMKSIIDRRIDTRNHTPLSKPHITDQSF